MSRIDEAWKRTTGEAAETRAPLLLERFALEKGPRLEESNISSFATPVSYTVERRTAAAKQKSQAPPAPVAPQRDANLGQDTDLAHSDSIPEGELSSVQPEKLIDVRQVADYIGFLAGSLHRHKVLAAGTFAVVLGLTVATAVLLPKTYHAEVKLLAQRNAVMAALSNPGRAVPGDADAPTRAAAETILRRDNLITLISQTNLMDEWARTRAPILKVKDALMGVLRRRPTADEKLDQIEGLLETRMKVVAGPVGDGTVTIDLDWPNADMAYRLVEAAQKAFVEARQVAETAAISESIAILERSGTALHADIDRTLTELQRTQAQRRVPVAMLKASAPSLEGPVLPPITATLPPVPAAALGLTVLGADLDDPQIPTLKAALTAKRQEITSLEETRQRQLSELQGRLAQLTTVYTATHPSVVAVQQNIVAVSRESPAVAALKAEAEKLEAEYQQRVAAAEDVLQEEQLKTDKTESAKQTIGVSAPRPVSPSREVRTSPSKPEGQSSTPGGETTDFASLRLRLELNQLQSLFERTDGARIELAVSQAAFKYRYTVIRPAQVPKAPVKPNLPMVIAAGFVGSLVLALVAAVGKDLLGGRIIEHWQVERQLGLPVLGNLRIV